MAGFYPAKTGGQHSSLTFFQTSCVILFPDFLRYFQTSCAQTSCAFAAKVCQLVLFEYSVRRAASIYPSLKMREYIGGEKDFTNTGQSEYPFESGQDLYFASVNSVLEGRRGRSSFRGIMAGARARLYSSRLGFWPFSLNWKRFPWPASRAGKLRSAFSTRSRMPSGTAAWSWGVS